MFLVLVLAALAVPVSPDAAGAAARKADQLVDCSHASTRVTITVTSHLDSRCTYTGGFDITASNVTLDCRGALLRDTAADGVNAIVVAVDANANLQNVTIRDCRIEGFFHGIDIARNGVNQLAAGHEYDHYLRNVVVEDTNVADTHAVGIYVHPYVTGTVLRGDVVTGSASTGLYLDEGSRGGRIEGNVFASNGFVENGPGGTNTSFGGLSVRFWGPGREGIAVDGSSDNVIRGNWIAGNSAGGVFLYTNCGENVHTDPADWLDHRYGAEHNDVEGNVIAGSGTGVWVASRMGENVYPMDCSDVPYVSGPFKAITLDRAPYTTVRANVIVGAAFGVRVEDDHATVVQNWFVASSPADYAVIVGTPYRTGVLGEPVTDALVAGNLSSITGNPSPYRWVDGVSALHDAYNVALGKVSALCKAPDVPRGPFVMVYAVAPQDPSQPPVPPPAYTVASLGVLPACA
jgi:parallel beta-helix repeat protein